MSTDLLTSNAHAGGVGVYQSSNPDKAEALVVIRDDSFTSLVHIVDTFAYTALDNANLTPWYVTYTYTHMLTCRRS